MTIESTTQIVQVAASPRGESIDCRLWEGTTEHGVKVQVLIPRVAVKNGQDVSQFEAELQEHAAPSVDGVMAFPSIPLRMIL